MNEMSKRHVPSNTTVLIWKKVKKYYYCTIRFWILIINLDDDDGGRAAQLALRSDTLLGNASRSVKEFNRVRSQLVDISNFNFTLNQCNGLFDLCIHAIHTALSLLLKLDLDELSTGCLIRLRITRIVAANISAGIPRTEQSVPRGARRMRKRYLLLKFGRYTGPDTC